MSSQALITNVTHFSNFRWLTKRDFKNWGLKKRNSPAIPENDFSKLRFCIRCDFRVHPSRLVNHFTEGETNWSERIVSALIGLLGREGFHHGFKGFTVRFASSVRSFYILNAIPLENSVFNKFSHDNYLHSNNWPEFCHSELLLLAQTIQTWKPLRAISKQMANMFLKWVWDISF